MEGECRAGRERMGSSQAAGGTRNRPHGRARYLAVTNVPLMITVGVVRQEQPVEET